MVVHQWDTLKLDFIWITTSHIDLIEVFLHVYCVSYWPFQYLLFFFFVFGVVCVCVCVVKQKGRKTLDSFFFIENKLKIKLGYWKVYYRYLSWWFFGNTISFVLKNCVINLHILVIRSTMSNTKSWKS